MAAFAFLLLQQAMVATDGPESPLARAGALYVAVAVRWFVPDRRIERVLADLTEDARKVG